MITLGKVFKWQRLALQIALNFFALNKESCILAYPNYEILGGFKQDLYIFCYINLLLLRYKSPEPHAFYGLDYK